MHVNGKHLPYFGVAMCKDVYKYDKARCNEPHKNVGLLFAECLHARWQGEDDPVPFEDVHNTFCSD
jgi:hypothetical protein